MRVRKRKGLEDYLNVHEDLVFTRPQDWKVVFGNSHPIQVEVGCGKGDFIVEMGNRHPEVNYIGVDLQESVISYALDKVLDKDLSNVKLILANGSNLAQYFPPHAIDLLYLNFSDPWPKLRHEKRRLTHASFLSVFEELLKPGGEIHFKTDNLGLFEYSLVSMSQYGMVLNKVWLDLHRDLEFAKENAMTEYEEKFSSQGHPIYRLEARFQSKDIENEMSQV